jgi:hypothetical protein
LNATAFSNPYGILGEHQSWFFKRCLSNSNPRPLYAQGKSNLGEARAKGMKAPCPICKMPLVDYFQLKQHYDTKHPKADYPPPP